MAPPVSRRSTWSRRAQYSAFGGYVAGVLGAIVGAVLLVGALVNPARLAPARGVLADAAAPFARLFAGVRHQADDIGAIAAGYATSGAENARLRREVALARVRLVAADAAGAENRRLKALLGLAADVPHPVALGWLIASTPASTRRFATISAGAKQGVRPGMPVRSPLGLVGRVLEVGRSSARVLLLTDAESVVPVRRARDGLPGFVSGRADGTLQLRLIALGLNPLHRGDAFVTSGSGGLYWPGTPIAVVRSLTRDGAIAEPLADPAASEAVEVQPEYAPTADATLPTPAPTVPPPPPRRHAR